MKERLPAWADAEKLEKGRKNEEEACKLFERMYHGTRVARYHWNNIVDGRILIDGRTEAYIEIKGHSTSIGWYEMNNNGTYEVKGDQLLWAIGMKHVTGIRTVFMVRMRDEWYYIDDLATATIRELQYREWKNQEGNMVDTLYARIPLRAFLPFPKTPSGFLRTRLAPV